MPHIHGAVTDRLCTGQFPGDVFHDIEEISKFLPGSCFL